MCGITGFYMTSSVTAGVTAHPGEEPALRFLTLFEFLNFELINAQILPQKIGFRRCGGAIRWRFTGLSGAIGHWTTRSTAIYISVFSTFRSINQKCDFQIKILTCDG
jgi:hypothetical protein